MTIELTPDAAQWIDVEVASGAFASRNEAVQRAADQHRSAAPRAKLDAAIAEAGRNTSEDALRFVQDQIERRNGSVKRG